MDSPIGCFLVITASSFLVWADKSIQSPASEYLFDYTWHEPKCYHIPVPCATEPPGCRYSFLVRFRPIGELRIGGTAFTSPANREETPNDCYYANINIARLHRAILRMVLRVRRLENKLKTTEMSAVLLPSPPISIRVLVWLVCGELSKSSRSVPGLRFRSTQRAVLEIFQRTTD